MRTRPGYLHAGEGLRVGLDRGARRRHACAQEDHGPGRRDRDDAEAGERQSPPGQHPGSMPDVVEPCR